MQGRSCPASANKSRTTFITDLHRGYSSSLAAIGTLFDKYLLEVLLIDLEVGAYAVKYLRAKWMLVQYEFH